MNRNMKIILICVLSATAIGGAVYYFMRKPPEEAVEKPRTTAVETTQAIQSSIARKKIVSGTLKAAHSVTLVSEIQGRIDKINCSQGQVVKQGDVLFQLDSNQAEARLQEAKAQFTSSKMALDRQKKLMDTKSTSQAAVEKAMSDYLFTLAKVKGADADLKATKIIAPFDGQLGLFNLSVGAHVSPNQELTRLVSFGPLEVEFQMPESEVKHISIGQIVSVLAEGFDLLPVSGTILAVDPYSDSISHTVRVKAILTEESVKLRDGGFAEVTITLGESRDAIIVPKQAIGYSGDTPIVYTIDGNHAREIPVNLGFEDGINVQIEDGVTAGMTIIIDPVDSITDDTLIEVVNLPSKESNDKSSESPKNKP
jgi:membrane fusion protein (multidrug efflux system)